MQENIEKINAVISALDRLRVSGYENCAIVIGCVNTLKEVMNDVQNNDQRE